MDASSWNYYYQVSIILTNRLFGCCSCLAVITLHLPGYVSPDKSVRHCLQLQHPRGLVQQPPPPSLLLPALYLRNKNWATWARAGSRSTSEQEQASCWEECEQQVLPCSKHKPADIPLGFNTEHFPQSFSVRWSS